MEAVDAQVLGAADEVAGRVVDQPSQGAVFGPDAVDDGVHGLGLANVQLMRKGLRARVVVQHLAGLLHHGASPAAQVQLGTQFRQLGRHGQAQPRAAPGDQDALALE